MKKYIECGFGNTWWLRTEFEHADGDEYEMKGIVGKIKPRSIYLRFWLGKSVLILDTKSGLKVSQKPRRQVKLLFGIVSEP